ncbi:MAG: spermidine/putrescine ABC transporter substrate-binding protein [Anaerolineae bacterium]|nr:spermidine/putrescine ABC transporter substrate-binding protein [Thermoflexales bacterium]MDW8395752.1 spermidine/putrescine ABC transporter substrate-binding protein [Anaerolineae bacterium]
MNRRAFLRLSFGLGSMAALSAACGGQQTPAPVGESAPTTAPAAEGLARQLNWYTWGGYSSDAVLDKFRQEFGVTVNVETYGSNEEMEAKFKAGGNPGYDLITPSDYMVAKMIAAGMLEKINFNNIPNFAFIDPGHKKTYFDPTDEYSVAYNWGTTGFAYNKTRVEAPIDNWKQVMQWPDALKNRLGLLDDIRETMAMALRTLGFSGNTENPDEVNAARDALVALKRRVNFALLDSPGMKTSLVAGDLVGAMIYANDAVMARNENPDIVYVIPGDVSSVWQDNLCIPKGVPSKVTAEAFINFLCRPDIAALNANDIGLSTPNAEALRQGLIDPKLASDKAIYPDVQAMGNKLEYLRKGSPKMDELYQRAFDEVRSA